jgi:hypothetical protein
MKLTLHQQELMGQAGAMCVQAGAETQAALRSCRSTITALDELIGSVEDPAERDQWSSVRQLWIEIASLLEQASSKFEKG